MCGFAGEARFDSSVADIGAVSRMAGVLHNRGPDAAGAFQQGPIALAHRRLSIIDLSAHAQQPMTDPELGLTLVFNGCIYNYRELRKKLESLGYRFFSHGDTEVVLKSFHAWGPACVQQFHGMFAFALWERDSERLILARDRFGIKPLYLAPLAGGVRFASTLPALLAGGGVDTAIDPVALHHYMTWHAVVPPPHTMLVGVRKLPPATITTFEPDGTRHDVRYWKLSVRADRELDAMRREERERLVEAALSAAVERRMVADVPVGVLLSGGVDSSLIVALLAEHGQRGLETFSIGFEAAYGEAGDEFRYSDLVAERFATRHHQIRVPTPDLAEVLPAMIQAMSEPMVSYDNVGFFLLSREVAKHVKVVQSGQGADEVFAGYDWYAELGAQPDAHDVHARYAHAFFDRDHDDYVRTVGARWQTDDVSGDFVKNYFAAADAGSAVEKALHLDTMVMLPDDPVKRVDNMTMAWSLEARVPFLDHELVELAGRLPAADKLGDGGKGILKAIARKRLPREVVDRPKGYFPVPALKYLDGPVLQMVRDVLGSRVARERGLFRPEAIRPWLDAPSEHITRLRGSKLWQVALLELWLAGHGL